MCKVKVYVILRMDLKFHITMHDKVVEKMIYIVRTQNYMEWKIKTCTMLSWLQILIILWWRHRFLLNNVGIYENMRL